MNIKVIQLQRHSIIFDKSLLQMYKMSVGGRGRGMYDNVGSKYVICKHRPNRVIIMWNIIKEVTLSAIEPL